MKLAVRGARRWAAPLMLAAALTVPAWALAEEPAPRSAASSKKDPFESFNRSVFSFNEAVDAAVLKPAAQAYKDIVPEYVRTLVDNVFGNLADAWSTVNQLLQGKVENTVTMGMRVIVNTGLGFGGLLDIGSEIGLEKKSEDFGQTLGRWGVPGGPYVVLPVLGPSTLRDTAALPIDWQASPSNFVGDERSAIIGVVLLQAVSTRAGLLGASKVLDDIALDKYSFLRDAYLARRQNQVYDGDPPEAPSEEEAEEPAPKEAPAKETLK